jgi:competence protein ComEA
MRTVLRTLFVGAGLPALAAFLLVAGSSPQAAQNAGTMLPSTEGLPEGPGRDVTAKVCGICHEARRAASLRLTEDGWAFVIDDMIRRGARATDDEKAQILAYLSTHFLGEAPRPLNVNTAPQIDLESVIGLLRREAAAIISYREANGPCKTLDDLKKVPNVDFAKIEAAKDRIVCF